MGDSPGTVTGALLDITVETRDAVLPRLQDDILGKREGNGAQLVQWLQQPSPSVNRQKHRITSDFIDSSYFGTDTQRRRRGIKARIGPMHGLKRLRRAEVTIADIEPLHRICNNQFNLGRLPSHAQTAIVI